MSEPARSTPPHDAGGRTALGPLRDWLAAMKTQSSVDLRGPARSEPVRQDPKAAVAAEAAWSPRIVEPVETSALEVVEDADLSELMAENLMLKAKLRLEAERQDELQAMLADEIRALREHVREEIGTLEELRAAQEAFGAERERFRSECSEIRAERDRATAKRDALRAETVALAEERDLWRARTEALAQPLFQMQKR